jgi:hypothetical protein
MILKVVCEHLGLLKVVHDEFGPPALVKPQGHAHGHAQELELVPPQAEGMR